MENKPNKFLMWCRKKVIALKRNYYIIPMLVILVAFIQFTCNLYVISPTATFIYPTINDFVINPGNYPTMDIGYYGTEIGISNFYSLFIFIITLLSIIYTVSFIFFMQNKNEGKKKWFFFGLFFAVSVIIIVLEVLLRSSTILAQYLYEYNRGVAEAAGEDIAKISETIKNIHSVESILLTNTILLVVSMIFVGTSPLCQKLVKKIKFGRISTNEKQGE